MKFGLRVPSLKKRIAARTSLKRVIRHKLGVKAPKGMGILTNPKKALYNKIYNKTTVGIDDFVKPSRNTSSSGDSLSSENYSPGIEISNTGDIIRSSSKALTVTSGNFESLREEITEIYNKRTILIGQLNSAKTKLFFLSALHYLSYLAVVGFFYKNLAELRNSHIVVINDLEGRIEQSFITLSFADQSQFEKSWLNCIDSFTELMKSEKIWDITYAENINTAKARTVAKTATKRTLITSVLKDIEFIKCDLPHMHIPNANGPDLFFFPTFLLLYKDQERFGIFDLKEVNAHLNLIGYVEEEKVPNDTEIIQYTWKKANKDGSMDKRFKGNYKIPVVKYGDMKLDGAGGLEESFMFSNSKPFTEFANNYNNHIKLLCDK